MSEFASFADEDFCYLTTTGRVSGREHTIEIWFALDGNTVYMLSGGGEKSDWVKNLRQRPAVQIRIRDRTLLGTARLAEDGQEDALVRRLLFEKYTPRDSDDLTDWARISLPVVVDLHVQ
jgi:deazaflavin-dependent oxidoreductase (nitroreductase family)